MSLMNAEQPVRPAIAILARAPIAGLAKTRLIPHLGADGAAALQRWMLQRTLATAVLADLGPITVWCTPEIDHLEFTVCRALPGVELRRQPEGDLGERMVEAIAESPGSSGTLVMGTDCPMLTASLLQQAADSLLQHHATVIPAEDGGYVLIGMRQVQPEVFRQVDWSTDRVMAQTRQRLQSLDWQWQEFPPLWDIDRAEDFERLAEAFPDLRSFIRSTGAAS